MTQMSPPAFIHRYRKDGSIVSICIRCFAVVAKEDKENDLATREQEHLCDTFAVNLSKATDAANS